MEQDRAGWAESRDGVEVDDTGGYWATAPSASGTEPQRARDRGQEEGSKPPSPAGVPCSLQDARLSSFQRSLNCRAVKKTRPMRASSGVFRLFRTGKEGLVQMLTCEGRKHLHCLRQLWGTLSGVYWQPEGAGLAGGGGGMPQGTLEQTPM